MANIIKATKRSGKINLAWTLRRYLILLASGLLLMSGPRLQAQTTSATILGTVTDTTGAVVVGATVTVADDSTGTTRVVRTGDLGNYEVPGLVPGNYKVLVEYSGFKSYLRSGLFLEARNTLRVDAKLAVGDTQEQITVSETAPAITTETGTVSDEIGKQNIQSLPLNYRAVDTSPLSLVSTVPGVQVDPAFGISIAGSHPAQNEISIDGFSVTNIRFNGPLSELLPSTETVQEVKVTSELGNAEYGQVGDISFVSHGGTNQYHGSVFEYLQNDALNATPLFASQKPVVRANDFGLSIGGPVQFPHYRGKDKTFFYVTWERNRFHNSNVISQGVPTLAMRNGDFSSLCSRFDANGVCNDPNGITLKNPFTGQAYAGNKLPAINQVAANVLNTFYPLPNFDTGGAIASNYRVNAPAPVDTNLFDIRIDQKIKQNQTVWARLSWKNIDQIMPLGLKQGHESIATAPRNVGVNYTYVIRPTLLNEVRFGFSQENDSFVFNQFPDGAQTVTQTLGLNLPGPFPKGSAISGFQFFQSAVTGTANGREEKRVQRRLQVNDNLTWIRGRHTLKFGVDVRRQNLRDFVQFLGADDFGVFSFSGAFTGSDLADFELGLPSQSAIAITGPDFNAHQTSYAFYGQDQFQLSPKLTINVGLRYEVHPPFFDRTLQMTNFDPTNGDVVVPNPASVRLASPGFLQAIDACPGSPNATNSCTPVVTAQQDHLPQSLRHTDLSKVLPRLSVAYRLTPRWVMRGGFGIYDETLTGETFFSLVGIHTADVRVFQNSVVGGVAAIQFPNTVLSGNGQAATGTEDFRTATQFDLSDPYAQQWSLSVEHELGHNTGLRLSYTGLRSVNLLINPDVNQIQPQAAPYDPTKKPFPNFRIIYSTNNGGSAIYNGLQAVFTRRFEGGLSFQSSYIFSKNLSDAEGSAGNLNGGFAQENGPFIQNRFDPHADYGDVSFTRRHRWLSTYLYELPLGKGKKFGGGMPTVLNAIVGGWRSSGILLLQSGPYLTPFYFGGTDPSGTGANFKDPGQRPDRVCNGNIANPRSTGYFDPACFQIPADNIGRFGSSGVGILKGPGTINLSAGISKVFPIQEKIRLRFEATANNIINHANLGVPDLNVASGGDFGVVHNVQPVEGSGARTIQLGLRLEF